MAGKKEIESRAEELLKPVTDANGVRIYDVEYVKEGSDWYLRVYIDKDGGVNIQDCENVSRAFSDRLDAEDFIAEAYILEVSSPGLGRQLKKDRHFENSIGEEVELKLFEALDGEKEFTGILERFDRDTVTLRMESGEERAFKRSRLAVIRLTVDF
ncbi:MAG: ribosome maturation factor RimP [Lachnospiraceae bacterium]|nr:ribosome maturation factor RimP [Lachnospiraceae bacterium]